MRADRTVVWSPWWALCLVAACSGERAGDAALPSEQAALAGTTAATTAGASGSNGIQPTTPSGMNTATPGGMRTQQPAASGSAAPATSAGPSLPDVAPGSCCPDGKCLCRGAPPGTLSAQPGPYEVMQYELAKVGCVFYPLDAAPPLAAVAIADGFGGSGGCDSVQSQGWGPLYASHGIVSVIVETGTGDQASARAQALLAGIAAFKAENTSPTSPLSGKLAGRYGTSGFSVGGSASIYTAQTDKTLLSSVAIMPWGRTEPGGSVPTLVVCGASDGDAPCSAYGTPAYAAVDAKTPKLRVSVMSGHNGQPSAADGATGAYVLAFQKLFLEGDERWRQLLIGAPSEETTIQ